MTVNDWTSAAAMPALLAFVLHALMNDLANGDVSETIGADIDKLTLASNRDSIFSVIVMATTRIFVAKYTHDMLPTIAVKIPTGSRFRSGISIPVVHKINTMCKLMSHSIIDETINILHEQNAIDHDLFMPASLTCDSPSDIVCHYGHGILSVKSILSDFDKLLQPNLDLKLQVLGHKNHIATVHHNLELSPNCTTIEVPRC